ncbi:MAG: hypothetical protein ACI87M_000733, partial [Yoonia sp.]
MFDIYKQCNSRAKNKTKQCYFGSKIARVMAEDVVFRLRLQALTRRFQ